MISVDLLRRLGFKEAFAIVVGSMIGTGVFLKTAGMAQDAGAPLYVLLAWLAAGALSLMGALTYAELGCLFPKAGGEYVFLRNAYGPLTGFLYGWTRFWIAAPGSIAAYAIGGVTFLESLVPIGNYRLEAAIAVIGFFTVLNCFSVLFGGAVQTVMTAVKIVMVMALAAAIMSFGAGTSWDHLGSASAAGWKSWSGFGLAVLAALWAYDGWNNLPMAAGEIRYPDRVIPQSLVGGVIAVFLLYVGANIAYFYALPFAEVANSNSTLHPDAMPVAIKAALHSFGGAAVTILSLAFVFSALGAMNGSILTGARVPYAMAQDGLMWSRLGQAHPRTHSPVASTVVQGVWACVLAASGTFDQLTNCIVFASWIFYALTTSSLFYFRRTLPAPAYRTPWFPWPPLIFIGCAVLLIVNTLWTMPKESLAGLGMIALGIPVYFLFRHRRINA
ncbi:APC family permease [Rhodoplanes sp. Z2-YC6860]|uniref:APC family permease n=1 Tax=Rhodoplanes sp. Z2-YC6860 TaxID=674703 RepID=UPI0012EDA751|nr:amino acid permease [Rhodoplanes sp. Z2-YC6860]